MMQKLNKILSFIAVVFLLLFSCNVISAHQQDSFDSVEYREKLKERVIKNRESFKELYKDGVLMLDSELDALIYHIYKTEGYNGNKMIHYFRLPGK